MRVLDLDRDMRDVIPTSLTRDSDFLFDRMTRRTFALTRLRPGSLVLDVASGLAQDARALAARGARVVAAEPSARMSALAQMENDKAARQQPEAPRPHLVRSWGDALPFAKDHFDAVFCKGAIDHFDTPAAAIAEMARVTRPDGRVVLAIANFDSFACRASRVLDAARERWLRRPVRRGRRHYDVPHDHFTRYELDLMREQAGAHLHLEVVEGISLAWGLPGWSRTVASLPERVARGALEALDGLARRAPGWADVVVLAGRPRHEPVPSRLAAGRKG